jgi:DNA polymerase III alpha subunit
MEKLSSLMVDPSDDIERLQEISEFAFVPPINSNRQLSDYDKEQQSIWFMPEEYYHFDIKQYCLTKCTTDDEKNRVEEELHAFEKHGMLLLLQWLKYFVDTCNNNNVFWGVGRGSSVSSFVLYLIGVHRINSIKYKLDWKEFLR